VLQQEVHFVSEKIALNVLNMAGHGGGFKITEKCKVPGLNHHHLSQEFHQDLQGDI